MEPESKSRQSGSSRHARIGSPCPSIGPRWEDAQGCGNDRGAVCLSQLHKDWSLSSPCSLGKNSVQRPELDRWPFSWVHSLGLHSAGSSIWQCCLDPWGWLLCCISSKCVRIFPFHVFHICLKGFQGFKGPPCLAVGGIWACNHLEMSEENGQTVLIIKQTIVF